MNSFHASAPLRIVLSVLSSAATFLVSTAACSADFQLSDSKHELYLEGEIEQGDYHRIMQVLLDLDALPRTISLNSPGGDIEEAIKIGKLLRRALFQSTISRFGQCDSACFILWVSAVRKFHASVRTDQNTTEWEGKIGLHRPYYGRSEYSQLTTGEAKNAYHKLDMSVRQYLSELKIPSDITERMFRTKSTDADYVSDAFLIDKLGTEAPFFEEWLIAKCGELTSEEKSDFALLIVATLLAANTEKQGNSLPEENPGQERFASMSAGYKKYLGDKAARVNTCRAKAETDETKKVLRELRREQSAGR
jgi:hypothetical protein